MTGRQGLPFKLQNDPVMKTNRYCRYAIIVRIAAIAFRNLEILFKFRNGDNVLVWSLCDHRMNRSDRSQKFGNRF